MQQTSLKITFQVIGRQVNGLLHLSMFRFTLLLTVDNSTPPAQGCASMLLTSCG